MKISTFALLLFCTQVIASDEIQLTLDQNKNIITLSEKLEGNEKSLFRNELIFPPNNISKPLTIELQPQMSSKGTERVIPIERTLEDLEKFSSSPGIADLIKYFKAHKNNENDDCGKKGQNLQRIFERGGSCESGKCALYNNMPEDVIEKALAYDEACKGGQNLPNQNERLATTIAIYINDTYLCSGYKSGNIIITARHCFYKNNYVPKQYTITRILENNEFIASVQFKYSYLSDMTERHTVNTFLRQGSKISHYNDTIILDLSESSSFDISGFSSHSATNTSQAQLTTVNRFLVQDLDKLDSTIREYNKPMCSVIAASDKCILHNCSALPTNSGAPIYQFNNYQNSLIGIHVGILDETLFNQCDDLNPTLIRILTRINVAIPINKTSNPMLAKATEI